MHIRLTDDEKAYIQAACKEIGATLSGFLLVATMKRAEETLKLKLSTFIKKQKDDHI